MSWSMHVTLYDENKKFITCEQINVDRHYSSKVIHNQVLAIKKDFQYFAYGVIIPELETPNLISKDDIRGE